MREGLITETHLNMAMRTQRETEKPLGRILVDMGLISENVKLDFLRRKTGFPTIVLSEETVEEHILTLVPRSFAAKNQVVPVRLEGGGLLVAMEDPTDLIVIDHLTEVTSMPIHPAVSSSAEIEKALELYGEAPAEEMDSLPLHVRQPSWFRVCRYLFMPLFMFGPVIFIVSLLLLFPDSDMVSDLAGMFSAEEGDPLTFNFDIFLFTFLGWGLWSVIVFEINGLLFDVRKSPKEEAL